MGRPTMIRAKIHRQGKETLLAAADSELLGQTFREGKLTLTVHRAFYDGGPMETSAVVASLRACTVANLVGERTVGLAIEHGLVDPANVLRIGGIPHAQIAVL
jgi:hypothetical protein